MMREIISKGESTSDEITLSKSYKPEPTYCSPQYVRQCVYEIVNREDSHFSKDASPPEHKHLQIRLAQQPTLESCISTTEIESGQKLEVFLYSTFCII